MRYVMDFGSQAVTYGKTTTEAEVNRLFCAAVISKRFRDQLLQDPALAIAQGYNGESFSFTPELMERFSSIRAESLSDFAAQFLAHEMPLRVEIPVPVDVR
ncbi:MAG: hypothetical protein N3A60_01420 [Thermanaerothrix sp.]|nr:hypothetical protein [Thermanaerothrix sp.]